MMHGSWKREAWVLSTLALLAAPLGCSPGKIEGKLSPTGDGGPSGAPDAAVPPEEGDPFAFGRIEGRSGSRVSGTATFSSVGTSVKLVIRVEKATPGQHGVHIHQFGDCGALDGTSAGPHWDPTSSGMHGTMEAGHLGDIGNIMIGSDGTGRLELTSDEWSPDLASPMNPVGKAVIIHEKRDDQGPMNNGNAGGRVGCAVITSEPNAVAVATLRGKSGTQVVGSATFTRVGTRVQLELSVANAPQGEHGIHIHERADCSAEDGTSAGPHWNPTGAMHGSMVTGHLGDLGNIMIGADGKGHLSLTSEMWSLDPTNSNTVFGHAIILHANRDDQGTANNGNAGARIGCGVIGQGGDVLTARFEPKGGSRISGGATFSRIGDQIKLVVTASGAMGRHGIHIHEKGDCSAFDGTSTGGHWNPQMGMHSGNLEMGHLGDVGNIQFTASGTAALQLTTNRWSMIPGAVNSLAGHAIIIHANPDDGSANNGNAGARVACAVIGPEGRVALADVEPKSTSTTAAGRATFIELGDRVQLSVSLRGLPPGEHGVHIHETGDCAAANGSSAGDHWNPLMAQGHGSFDTGHLGDIGNVTIGADGTGHLDFTTDRWSIVPGASNSVLGKAVIVHANRDDGGSVMNGNAGPRIGCAVIGEPGGVAIAPIMGTTGSTLAGRATFNRIGDTVQLRVSLTGVSPSGEHGLHIHDVASCIPPDFTAAGSHWNPTNQGHGTIDVGHLGDIGNITVDGMGNGKLDFSTKRWTMGSATTSILGHAVILHAARDDQGSVANGNAMGRIACGEIRRPSHAAAATLAPRAGATITGRAFIQQVNEVATLVLNVSGAPPGEHGVHIHETGDCAVPDQTGDLAHWNPGMAMHGSSVAAHLGDLGNITVGPDGTGTLRVTTGRWSITRGPMNAVVGHSIVVHANRDDGTNGTNGNAGASIGCGVLGPQP